MTNTTDVKKDIDSPSNLQNLPAWLKALAIFTGLLSSLISWLSITYIEQIVAGNKTPINPNIDIQTDEVIEIGMTDGIRAVFGAAGIGAADRLLALSHTLSNFINLPIPSNKQELQRAPNWRAAFVIFALLSGLTGLMLPAYLKTLTKNPLLTGIINVLMSSIIVWAFIFMYFAIASKMESIDIEYHIHRNEKIEENKNEEKPREKAALAKKLLILLFFTAISVGTIALGAYLKIQASIAGYSNIVTDQIFLFFIGISMVFSICCAGRVILCSIIKQNKNLDNFFSWDWIFSFSRFTSEKDKKSSIALRMLICIPIAFTFYGLSHLIDNFGINILKSYGINPIVAEAIKQAIYDPIMFIGLIFALNVSSMFFLLINKTMKELSTPSENWTIEELKSSRTRSMLSFGLSICGMVGVGIAPITVITLQNFGIFNIHDNLPSIAIPVICYLLIFCEAAFFLLVSNTYHSYDTCNKLIKDKTDKEIENSDTIGVILPEKNTGSQPNNVFIPARLEDTSNLEKQL